MKWLPIDQRRSLKLLRPSVVEEEVTQAQIDTRRQSEAAAAAATAAVVAGYQSVGRKRRCHGFGMSVVSSFTANGSRRMRAGVSWLGGVHAGDRRNTVRRVTAD